MRMCVKVAMVAAAVGGVCGAAGAQTIHAVAPLPGGSITRITAVNSDGLAACGYSDNTGGQDIAIRWTLFGGTQSMGLLPSGSINSYAEGIDNSGTIICGYGDSGGPTRAFRWTTSGGYQILPFLSGTSGFNKANAISGNGNVITGVSGFGASGNGFTLDYAVNPNVPLNVCSGLGTGNAGLAVSNDGLTIVGTCGTGAIKRTYTPSSVLSTITGFPGQQWQMAEAVSANGAIITGRYSPSTGGEFGFRYGLTVPGFVQALPQTPNGCLALRPRAINGDGTVIVGEVVDNVAGFTAFVWTPARGTRLLSEHLQLRAVNLNGWVLTEATGISADGSAMCGNGLFNGQPRGWVVRNLPCANLNSPLYVFGSDNCVNGNAYLEVTFSFQVGTTPYFRWWKNGVEIAPGLQPSGSTIANTNTNQLVISNMQPADAGAYQVGISAQGACEQVSAPLNFAASAVLTQNVNPVATSACLGQNPFLFAVPSSPTIPPSSVTYRWQKFVGPLPTNWVNLNDGPTGNGGSTYFGTGTSTFSIFNAQGPDSGQYRCVFGVLGCGAASQIASTGAPLTVVDSLPAVNGPFDTSVCPGDNDAFFSVSATPCVGCTYQWQRYDPCPFINCYNAIFDGPTGNGGNYGGTQTPSLTIAGVYAGDFTQYRCIITMPCAGNVPSGEATLSPSPGPGISGPFGGDACQGGLATMGITLNPGGSVYQWQRYVGPCILCWQDVFNGPTGNGGTYSGAQTPNLSINGLNVLDTGTTFRCLVTDACGLSTVASNEWAFTLQPPPVIQTQPVGADICRNGNYQTFVTLAPGNYGVLNYQWWRYVPAFPIYVPLTDGTLPSGATVIGAQTQTLAIQSFQPQDAGQYYCMVIGSCGSTPSSVINLVSCFADFNCSGMVELQDIFDFLNAWFINHPSADFNGVGGVSLQDVFDFLNAWFAGC